VYGLELELFCVSLLLLEDFWESLELGVEEFSLELLLLSFPLFSCSEDEDEDSPFDELDIFLTSTFIPSILFFIRLSSTSFISFNGSPVLTSIISPSPQAMRKAIVVNTARVQNNACQDRSFFAI